MQASHKNVIQQGKGEIQMKTYRRYLSLFVAFALVLTVLSACSNSGGNAASGTAGQQNDQTASNAGDNGKASGGKTNLILTTAGTGGAFYPIGAAMAKIVNDNEPTLNITSQASGGSVENVRLLENKEVDFAMLGGDVAVDAYQGIGDFEGENGNFSGLFAMYEEPLSIVVPANSDIHSISDLAGKKVAVGAPGSGTEVKNKALLTALGVPYDKMKPQFISFAESVDALKDGNIDASMVWAGIPVPSIIDLSTVKDIRLIGFTEDEVKKATEASPYLHQYVIPSGTYKGVNQDTISLSNKTQAVVRNDVDETAVYNFVKAVFEHIDDLHVAHDSAKEITAESAVENAIPLHPGAEKYFKEAGVIK
jgi:hypothetical protein